MTGLDLVYVKEVRDFHSLERVKAICKFKDNLDVICRVGCKPALPRNQSLTKGRSGVIKFGQTLSDQHKLDSIANPWNTGIIHTMLAGCSYFK
jgi:hypothetical protein